MKDPFSKMAVGMVIGVAIAAVFGTAMDNTPIGIGAGMAMGIGIGLAMGGKI